MKHQRHMALLAVLYCNFTSPLFAKSANTISLRNNSNTAVWVTTDKELVRNESAVPLERLHQAKAFEVKPHSFIDQCKMSEFAVYSKDPEAPAKSNRYIGRHYVMLQQKDARHSDDLVITEKGTLMPSREFLIEQRGLGKENNIISCQPNTTIVKKDSELTVAQAHTIVERANREKERLAKEHARKATRQAVLAAEGARSEALKMLAQAYEIADRKDRKMVKTMAEQKLEEADAIITALRATKKEIKRQEAERLAHLKQLEETKKQTLMAWQATAQRSIAKATEVHKKVQLCSLLIPQQEEPVLTMAVEATHAEVVPTQSRLQPTPTAQKIGMRYRQRQPRMTVARWLATRSAPHAPRIQKIAQAPQARTITAPAQTTQTAVDTAQTVEAVTPQVQTTQAPLANPAVTQAPKAPKAQPAPKPARVTTVRVKKEKVRKPRKQKACAPCAPKPCTPCKKERVRKPRKEKVCAPCAPKPCTPCKKERVRKPRVKKVRTYRTPKPCTPANYVQEIDVEQAKSPKMVKPTAPKKAKVARAPKAAQQKTVRVAKARQPKKVRVVKARTPQKSVAACEAQPKVTPVKKAQVARAPKVHQQKVVRVVKARTPKKQRAIAVRVKKERTQKTKVAKSSSRKQKHSSQRQIARIMKVPRITAEEPTTNSAAVINS